MKFCFLVIFLLHSSFGLGDTASAPLMNLTNATQEKMSFCIGLIKPERQLQEMADFIAGNLACYDQQKNGFKVQVKHFATVPTKKQVQDLASQGMHLLLVLDTMMGNNAVAWRLYDTHLATMLKSGRCSIEGNITGIADMLSDHFWQLLVGSEGVFSTRLAFCKERVEGKHVLKDLVISSPFRYEPSLLVKGGKLLAPRWHSDPYHPMVLYSEVTMRNIRMMSVDMSGNRLVIANNDGLTMLPSFAHDGSCVVYCASRNGYSQLFQYETKKRSGVPFAKRIMPEGGNATSPLLCSNGDLIFCSDFKTKSPQIFMLSKSTGRIEQITSGGYCACPSYCEKTKKLAYIKMVGHVAQLWSYDFTTKKHTQLTNDALNKDECCWSPCGTYIAYVVHHQKQSRIAIMNIATTEHWFVTPPEERCSFPSWSLKYAGLPPSIQKRVNYSISSMHS